MKKKIENFKHRKKGAALVEYVSLLALIGVTLTGVTLKLGSTVRDTFETADSTVSAYMWGESDLSSSTASDDDLDECYTATDGDYFDAGYDCFVMDASEYFYANYASKTSDDITIYVENPNKPSVSGMAPEIELENGTVVWTDAGPHGDMMIYGDDDAGNIFIEFPDLICDNLDVTQHYGIDVIEVTDTTGISYILIDSSIDAVACSDGSGGEMIINEPYDTIIVPDYYGGDDDDDLSGASSDYWVMDNGIATYPNSWPDAWVAGGDTWEPLPSGLIWYEDELGELGTAGDYCVYDELAGGFVTDGMSLGVCYSFEELESSADGSDTIRSAL